MPKQYYADEATKNPIWLFQVLCDDNPYAKCWRTETVFSSREDGEAFGNARPHHWGKINVDWQVYSVPCEDERIAVAMASIRPDLVDEYSSRA